MLFSRFLKTPQDRQMQMILVKPPEERLEDLYFCQCVIKNLCLRSKFTSWRHNN